MARYSDASKVYTEIYSMRLAEVPRANNRALIDQLFNGNPPFSEQEAADSGIKTNVNFLEPAKFAHDARRQFSNAFLTPANFFKVTLDFGPYHKRREWSEIITQEINKKLKASLHYRETLKNVFAQLVLHGIGPVVWSNRNKWCPSMQMMSDVLIPSRTLLTMENLSKFAIRRRYTAEELYRLTSGPNVDKAWNMPVVKRCIHWAQKQVLGAPSNSTDIVYNPEFWQQDIKENSGFYSADSMPTIDCWDFYFLDETSKNFGWKRRILLDTDDSTPDVQNLRGGQSKDKLNTEFLYDSKERNYASNLSEIIHFQFADGSAVAPFRYHTIRSLGFLLYAVCHLQNRLRCKFTDAVFESMLQYFRVANVDDAERTIKLALVDKGVMPEGISFVPQSDRWKLDMQLVMSAFQMNRQSMEDSAVSYTQDFNYAEDQVEKTATQVTAEVTSASALVTTMLQEAYGYQEFQYKEICRRFSIPNSTDPDVTAFRSACYSKGVPKEALDCKRWDITAERIIGGGNKQMELGQINMLMAQYPKFSPEAQRKILRDFTFAATSDPARTNDLVPFNENQFNDSKYQAQLATGTLMQGLPVEIPPTINHIDYCESLLANMTLVIQQIEQTSPGMATKEQVIGLNNMANHINQIIAIIADDPDEKERARQYADYLGQMTNLLKGYAQRLQEQMQEAGQQGDPAAAAKVQATMLMAQTKAQIAQMTAEQKYEQKERAFEQKERQSEVKHQLDVAKQMQQVEVDTASKDLETAAQIQRDNIKAKNEPKEEAQPKESGGSSESSKPKKKSKKIVRFKREGGAITGAEIEEGD